MGYSFYDEQYRFVQNQYGRQPTFSSFLPGIAGPWGIPAWCNYNNRGQAVCSFGVQDKDHALMEFTAASTAYQRIPLTGFRTFIKINGVVTEAFSDGLGTMIVEPNVLLLHWKNNQVSVYITYYTLPNERMAGLCRKIEVHNLTQNDQEMEMLDGMAAIVPYGVRDKKLKQEANLSTAWMQVDNLEEKLPFFHVRASMEDTAKVTTVTGGNFRLAIDEADHQLAAIVQPSLVFGWDSAMIHPEMFTKTKLTDLVMRPQLTGNYMPCCFTPWAGILQQNGSVKLWEFYNLWVI